MEQETRLDVENNSVVIILSLDEDGFTGKMHHVTDKNIVDDIEQFNLNVLARGIMNAAVNDTERMLELGMQTLETDEHKLVDEDGTELDPVGNA